jgi:hypothetical protein
MRLTGYLQLDFQRRAPELALDGPSLAARAGLALHGAWLTSAIRPSSTVGVFFRTGDEALLTSDAPNPLPRRRVNDAGFNANSGHLRSTKRRRVIAAGFHLRQLGSRAAPSATTDSAHTAARQRSPTSAIDASPSTPANDRDPALRRFLRRCVAPCGAPAARPGYPVRRRETPAHRPFSSRVSPVQGTAASSRPERASLSRTSASPRWSMAREIPASA